MSTTTKKETTKKEMLEYKNNAVKNADILVLESGLTNDNVIMNILAKDLQRVVDISSKMTTKIKRDTMYIMFTDLVYAMSDIKFTIEHADEIREAMKGKNVDSFDF